MMISSGIGLCRSEAPHPDQQGAADKAPNRVSRTWVDIKRGRAGSVAVNRLTKLRSFAVYCGSKAQTTAVGLTSPPITIG